MNRRARLKEAAGETGLFTDGDWILSENMDEAGDVGVIQLKHVGVGCFQNKRFQFITGKTFEELDCTEVRQGDILISRMADPIGRACIVPKLPFRAVTAVDVSILRTDGCVAFAPFICLLCNSSVFRRRIEVASRGTTRNRITRTELGDLQIPLPPLPEQKRIAALLEKADRLRRTRRYVRQLSDTFLQSVFLEMFGDPLANPKHWKTDNLRSLCLKFSDGPFGSNLKSSHYTHEGVRVVRLQNIGVGDFIDDDKAFISPSHFANLAKHECVPGDVLIGTLGDPNLRACLLPPSIPLALNKADCVQARVDERRANRDYVRWLLNIPSTIHLAPGMAHGQTRTRISMGQLAVLPVPVPPLPLQQKWADIVRRFERLRAQQREAERQSEHLFQTLLHRAFAEGL